MTPFSGARISTTTLSVSIAAINSSVATDSPTSKNYWYHLFDQISLLFCHFCIVPSVMESPIGGTFMIFASEKLL
jgi:hypothetical protein